MALVDKAAISAEVDAAYYMDRNTFALRGDSLLAQIGDAKQDLFHPRVKLQPWNNKANLSIGLIKGKGSETVTTEGDTVVWKQGAREARFRKSGSDLFKFDVVYHRRPKGRLLYSITSKNLRFSKQLSLVEELKGFESGYSKITDTEAYFLDGHIAFETPEHIVNSIAVYHATKKHHVKGATNYGTGKAFHIERPKLFDGDGNWVWGDQEIDPVAGTYEVIPPVGWLETAKLPITIDPNYGYQTAGGSFAWVAPEKAAGGWLLGLAMIEPGTIDQISVYTKSAVNFKGLLFEGLGNYTLVSGSECGAQAATSGTGAWFASVHGGGGPTLLQGNNYYPSIVVDGWIQVAKDTAPALSSFNGNNSYTTPVDMAVNGVVSILAFDYSIYLTYLTANAGISNNPVTVIAAAKDDIGEALPSQAGAASDEIIHTGDMATGNNGSVAGPPTDGTPSYSPRLIRIRAGLGTEEWRYVKEEITTLKPRVSQAWTQAPVAGDSYEYFYGPSDADSAVGSNFTELLDPLSNPLPSDWVLGTEFIIDTGGRFAVIDGHSVTTDAVSSATVPRIWVKSGGVLALGYNIQGISVGGGSLKSAAPTDGDLFIGIDAGGEIFIYDGSLKADKAVKCKFNGSATFRKSKLFSVLNAMEADGMVSFEDGVSLQGRGNATDTVLVDASTSFVGPDGVINNNAGLITKTDLVVETITVRDQNFVDAVPAVTIEAKKTIDFVDCNFTPIIDEVTQTQIKFNSADATKARIRNSLTETVEDDSGTVLQNVKVLVLETLTNGDFTIDGITDVNGQYSGDFTAKEYTDNAGTSLTVLSLGGYWLKNKLYGKIPSTRALAQKKQDATVPMLADTDIVAVDASTAITNGAGIVLTSPANACSLIEWSGGAGTLAVGNTVSGASATGVVVEILEGDSIAGKAILDTRNTSAYVSVEAVSNGAGWTATLVDIAGSAEKRFTWRMDLANKSLQTSLDYQSAKTAENTLDAIWKSAIAWEEGEHSQMLQKSGANYVTERNVNLSEGVILTNRGAGTIVHMTADDGYQYVPPVAVTLQLDNITVSPQSRVFIKALEGGPLAVNTVIINELATVAPWTSPFIYIGDQPVVVRVRNYSGTPVYKEETFNTTITNTGLRQTISQELD